ncbi:MAG: triose-phosphate isomerase [Myxococcota bacterium]
MRRSLIAGNWKMFKTSAQAVELVDALKKALSDIGDRDIVVAPPFTALESVVRHLKGGSIAVAGQNMHWLDQGAYTGEVSAPMLKALGCEYVILGHSERRQHFGETDTTVNQRLKSALNHGLKPILCIGETLKERNEGKTWQVLTRQVVQGLNGVPESVVASMVIAYEPVWAIGTGVTATEAQAQEAHAFLRTLMVESYRKYVASSCRILYGGSVKPDNVDGLMALPDVDGVLVGGASLEAASFIRIARYQLR